MKTVIKLAWSNGQDVEIDAEVFGEWAVHQGPRTVHGRGKPRFAWQITHVPTGLGAICMETTGISKADALRVARHLARTMPTLPFDGSELRVASQKRHDGGETDERLAKTGKAVHREICKALGVPDAA